MSRDECAAAKARARAEIDFANALLDHAADLARQSENFRALATKILHPPEGTTIELGYGNHGHRLVRFVTEVEHAA